MLEPLRRLLRKKAWWIWTHEQKDAFKEFKDAVSKAPVLSPRMGFAFYWCSMVNQWHLEVGRSRWQRGSIHRSRSNFWRRSLALSVSTNMDGFFAAEDDRLTAIHPRRSRQASSTSADWRSNIIFTTRQSHSGNTSKAQSLSVTPDKP